MPIFPSPYLTGEFDEIDPARWRSATIETNRGCPYGCTYCDWGSATLSRIRVPAGAGEGRARMADRPGDLGDLLRGC